MREFNSAQEKILDKTLYLIGKKGSYDISIRDIAHAAGVNVNAINYYFGNKDNMLIQMEKFFIKNYLSVYSILDAEVEDEKKLLQWADEVMEYTLQYPGIMIILKDKYKSGQKGELNRFLVEQSRFYDTKLEKLLFSVFNATDDTIRMVHTLFYSAVLYPALYGTGFDFDDTKIREKSYRLQYLKFIISTLKNNT